MPDRVQIKPFAASSRLLNKLLDGVSILFGLWVLVNWFPELDSKSTLVIGLVSIGAFMIAAEVVGLYRDWRGISFSREAFIASAAWGLAVFGLLSLGRFTEYSTELSLRAISFWTGITYLFILGLRCQARVLLRWFSSSSAHNRGFAVVGINELGIELARNIRKQPELGLRFVGFFDDRPHKRTTELPAELDARLGDSQTLLDQARSGQIQVVFVTLPLRAEERIRDIVGRLADTTASVYIVPDLFVFQLLHSRWTDIQGIPVVSIYENPLYGVDGLIKRLCDVALATAALLALALPLLAIAAAVKLTSRGPVFFKQRRYGLDGREILVWKFRSMKVQENGPQVVQAQKNDPRLTPIGGFLRKTSLDELPQLLNVLGGSMSLVGPRPHATAHNEYYRKQIDGYMLRHKVKPGITGLAQVNGCRGETEQLEKMERRVHFDHKYIREWSLWLDLEILWKTFAVVLSRQNAY
jgi:putative colanic acid biosysnthesis UDP-glucose lipid carrier transferase